MGITVQSKGTYVRPDGRGRKMRRRALFFAAVALVAIVALPSTALGILTNEYGMGFAGQSKCLECHDGTYGQTVHGRFAKPGVIPAAPAGWTDFKAAGTPPVVGAPNPNSGLQWFSGGGSYSIAGLSWITLGDFAGGAATEYLFFNGSPAGSTVNPWNLVEGLTAEPVAGQTLPIDYGDYTVGLEDPEVGLFDVVYGCQRCHMLGTTTKTANSTDTAAIPNPTVSIPATYTTAMQWARDEGKTAADFRTDATVSEPGMSIQCEACHGTGFVSSTTTTKHWNSGTQLSHRVPAGTTAPGGTLAATNVSTLGQSQVCGQCHGSYTNVPGTLGIYGYTPNLPLRAFVDINGSSGGAAYTYTPTEAEFLAAPTKWFLFPNGSNAKGNHFYYDEWASSGHAYRGALTAGDPDILPGGTGGHYNAKTSPLGCAKCHTGEGYLKSKNAAIMADFTPTNANTGYMGQECIVCHNPHPSGVGAPDTIRQPDAAGVRSNAGRTTANTSLCEDCHNYQVEVLGSPIAVGASRVSHPQREVLAGRGMYDVPEATPFMPGAKCEQCHMPKTNKNANRVSHGMHIMMPGKAEQWNTAAGAAYKGEDSCSGCHAGETRTQLQANIDAWQSQTRTLLTEASAQLTAAKARTAAAAATDLDERATTLIAFVNGDGSTGVHNPPYAKAGLEKAIYFAKAIGATFPTAYASDSLAAGRVGFFGGTLLDGNGAPAMHEMVQIQKSVVGTSVWTTEGMVMSNSLGQFSAMIAPTSSTIYRAVWTPRAGSTEVISASKTVAVAAAKVASRTSINASTTNIRYGQTVRLFGYVVPNAFGQTVTIQRYIGSGRWTNMTTATLATHSNYTRTISKMKRGNWYFRTVYAGSSTANGSTSRYVKVVVR